MNTIKTAGIIAEYNPFHNGHHYQIEQVRRQTGADYVIAVMSGDFVQRGEPAIFDKYTRTNMALRGGADLVVELPTLFATSSAEDFSACGVALLKKLAQIFCVSEVNPGIWSCCRKQRTFWWQNQRAGAYCFRNI